MIFLLLLLLFVVLALLASLLLLPVGVELDYSDRGRRWYVVWLWTAIPLPGWVRRLTARGKEKGKEEAHPAQKREENRAHKPTLRNRIVDFVNGMRDGLEYFHLGIRTLKSVSPHIRVDVKRLDVTVATPNPALTGFTVGMLYAFGGAVAPSWPLDARPDFMRTTPEVSFRVRVTVTLAKLIPTGLRVKRMVARIRAERKEISEEKKS